MGSQYRLVCNAVAQGGTRVRRGIVFAAVTAIVAGGCQEPGTPGLSGATPDQPEQIVNFTLHAQSFSMPLPAGAWSLQTGTGDHVAFDLTKGGRLERRLDITVADDAAGEDYERREMLANGGKLNYRTDDDTDGGSGGPIGELTGLLRIGPSSLLVNCTDQDELARDPRWCLPYLGRLEIVN